MSTPTTVAEVVERIAAAQQRFLQAIAPLTAAQMQTPCLPGGWSVKDVLGHMAWWDQWLVYTLQPDGGPDGVRIAPPLVEEIPSGGGWADDMNMRVYAFNQQRELVAIQAEFDEARQRVLRFVQSLSDDDVFNPDGLAAVLDRPVQRLVLGIYEHYEEHAHTLEQLHR